MQYRNVSNGKATRPTEKSKFSTPLCTAGQSGAADRRKAGKQGSTLQYRPKGLLGGPSVRLGHDSGQNRRCGYPCAMRGSKRYAATRLHNSAEQCWAGEPISAVRTARHAEATKPRMCPLAPMGFNQMKNQRQSVLCHAFQWRSRPAKSSSCCRTGCCIRRPSCWIRSTGTVSRRLQSCAPPAALLVATPTCAVPPRPVLTRPKRLAV